MPTGGISTLLHLGCYASGSCNDKNSDSDNNGSLVRDFLIVTTIRGYNFKCDTNYVNALSISSHPIFLEQESFNNFRRNLFNVKTHAFESAQFFTIYECCILLKQ